MMPSSLTVAKTTRSLLALAGALLWGAVEIMALARSRRMLKARADHA
jgi:hypothetical protein